MSASLNVLLLEDQPLDAALVRRALTDQVSGSTVEHAQTKQQYVELLTAKRFDVVISDSSMPDCQGLRAFYLARELQPGVPVIYISGADAAYRDVNGLKALGVGDFVSKSNLHDLGNVIRRALREGNPFPPDYERFATVVRALSLARDLPGIMAIVRHAARQLTHADGATFVLREGDICYYADEDAIGPLWKGQKFPLRSCISGWAMIHQQPAVVEDIFSDPRIPLYAYEPTFARSVVMVPIRATEPLGAIGNYWARRRRPDPREVRLLQALADTTAVAMENVRVYAELESRVRESTAELEAFTYAISHDLRAPIRHIRGFATILQENYADKLGDGGTELARIKAAADRMGEMVEGLLELSRMTELPVLRSQFDLAALARAVAEECKAGASCDVEFIAPPSLQVEGDPTLLRIALENLLGNAWKFSGKNAAPKVELGVELSRGKQPVYFVRDNGAGFDSTGAAKLFGAFQRFHHQDEFPGTGVGLASVQRIIRKHDGNIWAESTPGEGATFYFTLAGASGASGI